MQDIENNMDELFRKAAGKYPLKQGIDDWDKIAPLLMQGPFTAETVQKKKYIHKYSSLFLFFFLFFIIAVIATTDMAYKTVAYNQAGKQSSPVKMEKTSSIDNRTVMVYQKHVSKNQLLNHITDIPAQYQYLANNNTGLHEKINFINQAPLGAADKESEDKLVVKEEILQAADDENRYIKNALIGKANPADPMNGLLTLDKLITSPQVINQADGTGTEKKEMVTAKTAVKKPHGIYLGIVFGPSFNQVKNQGLKKPGYDIGVLAGYQFNKKFSVETGLLYEKKYYFSDGKYFDMSKVSSNMPVGMKVLSLEGSCAVFEVPFKVKYNLYGKGDRHFYSTAGISAYIITREYNKYNAVINGTQQNITGNYNNTSRYLAAVLNAGVGYEKKVGKSALIRIEPYVQIPLKGIGVGSLPVMTAGLHIGFARFAY